MRLIDADRYRKILTSANPENYGSGNDDYDDGCISASENLLVLLDAVPTFDAKPAVHAHWNRTHDYLTTAYGSLDYYACSHCGELTLEEDACDYCPHCGAMMDEEGEA